MDIMGVNHNLPMQVQGKGIHSYKTKRLLNGYSVWVEEIESYVADVELDDAKHKLEYLGKSDLLLSTYFPDDEILAIHLATLRVGIVKALPNKK